MSDDIHRKRDYVLSLYSGPKWREKVAKMPDAQVVAIYLREHNKAPKQDGPDTDQESKDDGIPF